MPRPDISRIPQWYHKYIERVDGDDLVELMKQQLSDFAAFMRSIPAEKHHHRYAPGKWSIKDLFQHIIDGERIFAYRALRFARNDQTPLPGFEENDYAESAGADARNWTDMLDEFIALRQSNIAMFESFDQKSMEREGIASENRVYVGGIGFIMVGHINHHRAILSERYL